MNTLNHPLYSVEYICEILEAQIARKGGRVVSDAALVIGYMNEKITRKIARKGVAREYFITLPYEDMKLKLGLTESQLRKAKAKLSENGFIEALPPRKVDGDWIHVWRVSPSMGGPAVTDSATTISETAEDFELSFNRWLGMNWSSEEFEELAFNLPIWDEKLWDSAAQMKSAYEAARLEAELMFAHADLTEWRAAYSILMAS